MSSSLSKFSSSSPIRVVSMVSKFSFFKFCRGVCVRTRVLARLHVHACGLVSQVFLLHLIGALGMCVHI